MNDTQDTNARHGDDKPHSGLGGAVRRRRRALGLTLAGLAERSGLSVPFLSQIENERARPSIRSLQRIADGLRTTAVQLMAAADDTRTALHVVRAQDDPGLATDTGVRPLVRGARQMHALEFTGPQQADREFLHENDELMYVADGTAEVHADGRTLVLERGDTLYLTGGVRHRWRATSPDTRVLVVAVADGSDRS
ncbi:helix-turn-helix domain-containing protein [Streptomyces sp. NBC_00237]|uniref:helix-turn-helix domain-containing protein n=1 Tax=Streptomyces sp. NBC_00237 TaxID=2975687 RepID=UPI00225C3DAC|nr:helix-turn-helix domain-containing protein [Streptomyces sp. NBC_00237]MCX5206413.1 helix-turn-helix domain-containing protein [Streptomyces sp. NBC_00237]